MLRGCARAARGWMDRHPVKSSAVLYGSMYTLAEVSQQKVSASAAPLEAGKVALDTSSVKRYAIMGTLVFPPLLTRWYSWLDHRFPCTSGGVVAKKLLLDQFLFTPWVVVIFYVGMAWLEGKQGQERWVELQAKGLRTFMLDCCYWLPIQFLNFMFVPPWMRIGFIGVTTFLWLNILAYIKAMPIQ